MRGMSATTGRSITDLDHLYQSVGKILTTPLASRIKRRPFGSAIPGLTDAPNNGTSRVRLYAATASALMRWEPRITVTRVQLFIDENDHGQAYLDIEGYTSETGAPLATRVPLSNGGTT